MFAATVRDDSSPKFWKIMPIRRLSARRPAGGSVPTSMPSISTRPALGFSRALISRMSVDLPAPDAPITPNISPRVIDSDTPSNAAPPVPAKRL